MILPSNPLRYGALKRALEGFCDGHSRNIPGSGDITYRQGRWPRRTPQAGRRYGQVYQDSTAGEISPYRSRISHLIDEKIITSRIPRAAGVTVIRTVLPCVQ